MKWSTIVVSITTATVCTVIFLVLAVSFNAELGLLDTRNSLMTQTSRNITITTNENIKDENENCVSSQEIENVLSEVTNVHIMATTKSGGSSAVDFAILCAGESAGKKSYDPVILANLGGTNKSLWKTKVDKLIHLEKVPPVIGGHVFFDKGLMNVANLMDRRTSLIVYMYRNELERLISAIKFYIEINLCGDEPRYDQMIVDMQREMGDKLTKEKFWQMADGAVTKEDEKDEKCTVDEDFVFLMIESGSREIGQGNNRILTCDLYDFLEESDPNIMFMHFSQMDELQKMVAEKFCPHVLPNLPLHSNVHSSAYTHIYIHSKTLDKTFELQEWLQNKAHSFNLAFGETNQRSESDRYKRLAPPTCGRKTHQIEEATLSCPSQTTRLPNFK